MKELKSADVRKAAPIVPLLAGLSLMLSACAGPVMPYGAAIRTAAPEDALIMPPPGGPAIVSVLEHQYSNALEQRVMLVTDARTSGQNYIDSVFFGVKNYSRMNGQSKSYQSVNNLDIDKEMREELPGVAMKQSEYYVQNNYGPFGYAFGYGRGSDLCLYGWQQIRPGRDSLAAFGQAGTIQVRVRFCEAGATEDALLGIMYGYSINGTVDAYGWNPYGDANPPPPLLGKTGAPTYAKKVYDDRSEQISNTSKVLTRPAPRASDAAPVTRRATTTVAPAQVAPNTVQITDTPASSAVTVRAPATYTAPAAAVPQAPANAIPAPERQAATGISAAPSQAAPASAASSSIPGPPCRLLPGSTTVTCD